MYIKSLYTEYFQKSRVFFYPILDIRRGGNVTPLETYIAWKDVYTPEDCKFIVVYHIRDDEDYSEFESTKLLSNKLFDDYLESNDGNGIYVFDFEAYRQDWEYFLEGKYSKFSEIFKKKIFAFFKSHSGNFAHLDSYLNPEKHFERYAELLAVDVEVLKEVGELCDKPAFDKETFTMDVAELVKINIFEK
jgi:hypothetical protein